MTWPETVQRYPAAAYPTADDLRPDYAEPDYAEADYAGEEQGFWEDERERPRKAVKKRQSVDAWMNQQSRLLPRVKRKRIALILCALPAFVPWIFVMRGWISLNEKDSLSLSEADVLGTGGEYTFLLCVSITPFITVTGARWFAPLRRWYGVMFFCIGLSDSITASITGDFAGGPIGRIAGHDFLLAGFLIILLAAPVVVTSNSYMQKKLGRYWKKVQGVTYIIWGMIIFHLALLDGLHTFDGPQGDGDPLFHQRLYQIIAISLPLLILRLPPVRRWVTDQRAAGQQWKVWTAFMPLFALYLVAFLFVFNEEIFTGLKIITMNPPAN